MGMRNSRGSSIDSPSKVFIRRGAFPGVVEWFAMACRNAAVQSEDDVPRERPLVTPPGSQAFPVRHRTTPTVQVERKDAGGVRAISI